MKRAAFTLVEIFIVITIVLILAAAGLGAGRNIIRDVRISNDFNQIVLMVQQARTLALTGKDDIPFYGVDLLTSIDTSSAGSIRLFANKDGTPGLNPINRDSNCAASTTGDCLVQPVYALRAPSIKLYVQSIQSGSQNSISCSESALIFKKNSGDMTLLCNGNNNPLSLRVCLTDKVSAPTSPQDCLKSFTINNVAGIPQIEK